MVPILSAHLFHPVPVELPAARAEPAVRWPLGCALYNHRVKVESAGHPLAGLAATSGGVGTPGSVPLGLRRGGWDGAAFKQGITKEEHDLGAQARDSRV